MSPLQPGSLEISMVSLGQFSTRNDQNYSDYRFGHETKVTAERILIILVSCKMAHYIECTYNLSACIVVGFLE